MTSCTGLETVIDELERFLQEAWVQKTRALPEEVFARDLRFIKTARSVAAACDGRSLQLLQQEMRGLSHHFGSYADQRKLQLIVDRLYDAWRDATLRLR